MDLRVVAFNAAETYKKSIPRSTERFVGLYENLGQKVVIIDGIPWTEYNRMVIPLGPAKYDYLITSDQCQYLLVEFPNTFLVRSTRGFDKATDCKEWYAVICNNFPELSSLSGNTRSKIRRGLKHFRIERVEAKVIADLGYDILVLAHSRYVGNNKPTINEKEFRRRILSTIGFEDIVHYWGVFHGKKLVAFSSNYIHGGVEANYSIMKFSPESLRSYASYGLIYKMNEHYLRFAECEYVSDGFRSLLHKTNIQRFLIDKFAFQKSFISLSVYYKTILSWFLSSTYLLRYGLGKIHPGFDAIYKLEEIRRTCSCSDQDTVQSRYLTAKQ